MSRKNALNLTRAPAKDPFKTRSVLVALFFTLPVLGGRECPVDRCNRVANATAQVGSEGVFGTCWGKRQSRRRCVLR